jgi:hypothetical protein
MADWTRCTIKIDLGLDADDDERAAMTRNLRHDLLALNEVEHVESAAAAAPPGSKSAGIDLQSLMVTLVSSGGAVTVLIGMLQNWLTRREKASMTLEMGGDKLTITGVSSDDERKLVENWIRRHRT